MKENTLTREIVARTLELYEQAWAEQDTEKLLTIFTSDATYSEHVLSQPFRGHDEIAKYWREKVVKGQSRIAFKLLNTYVDGSTASGEWEVYFDDLVQSKRKHIIEIAVLEFRNERICSLREYWTSEVVEDL